MRIELTTDRACDSVTTALYRGEHRGGRAAASATELGCPAAVAGGAPGEIGDIVLVPSGSRADEVALTVVMGVEGATPDECLSGAEDPARRARCIYATRAFKYIEHASLTLPIHLSESCRGVRCAPGETCITGGECVDQHAVCGDGTCGLPAERERGDGGVEPAPAPADDGHVSEPGDAATDGSLPPVDNCGGSGVTVLTQRSTMPLFMAGNGAGRLYFVASESTEGDSLYSRPTTPGAAPVARLYPPLGESSTTDVIALDARGLLWVLGAQGAGLGMPTLVVGNASPSDPTRREVSRKPESVAIDPFMDRVYFVEHDQGLVSYVEIDGGVVGLTPYTTVNATGPLLAVSGAYYANRLVGANGGGKQLTVFSRDGGSNALVDAGAQMFASSEKAVYAVVDLGQGPKIFRLDTPPITEGPGVDGGAPASLAADSKFVYWIEKNSARIRRQNLSPSTPMEAFEPTGVSYVDHLVVAGECLYFWGEAEKGANLYVAPKTVFQAASPPVSPSPLPTPLPNPAPP